MRAVLLGARGQLGRSLTTRLPEAVRLDVEDLDIGDAAAVAAVDWSRFDTVFNAAAYTAVDRAETPEGRAAAWRTNAVGVANLAKAARDHALTLVHVSSEYVFDGCATGPMSELSPLSPISCYGASKAAGDLAAALCPAHYVVRPSWMVGDGPNFVRTMLGLAVRGVDPTVVADQIGRPTFADDLAPGIFDLVTSGALHGVYHLTNQGDYASWAEVARATFELAGHPPARVIEISTAEYRSVRPGCARRPLNSALDLDKAARAGVVLPPWRESLARYLETERTGR